MPEPTSAGAPELDPASEYSERGLCPHCGAVCDSYQEYCLGCGERLSDSSVVTADLAERLRRVVPATENDWFWPILAALVVAALAATFAIIATRQPGTTTYEALGPTVSQQTVTTPTASSVTTSTKPASSTSTSPTTPAFAKGLVAWPNRPAYTIVLASIPAVMGRQNAKEKALAAVKAGLTSVGVLDSSDYSSLHPDYYVVFAGIFSSERQAVEHLAEARRAGFPQPYVKRVES